MSAEQQQQLLRLLTLIIPAGVILYLFRDSTTTETIVETKTLEIPSPSLPPSNSAEAHPKEAEFLRYNKDGVYMNLIHAEELEDEAIS